MITLTTTLPDDLVDDLREYSASMKQPKNKFIEKALRLYFQHLKRSQYINSYQRISEDQDLLLLAEEGMETYLKEIEVTEQK